MAPMYESGMRMVAIGWVVIVTSGISSFIFLKRYVDRKRLELIKAKQRERMLEAPKESKGE